MTTPRFWTVSIGWWASAKAVSHRRPAVSDGGQRCADASPVSEGTRQAREECAPARHTQPLPRGYRRSNPHLFAETLLSQHPVDMHSARYPLHAAGHWDILLSDFWQKAKHTC
jgi:hypothetical protein